MENVIGSITRIEKDLLDILNKAEVNENVKTFIDYVNYLHSLGILKFDKFNIGDNFTNIQDNSFLFERTSKNFILNKI